MNYHTYEDFDLLFGRTPVDDHEIYYAKLLKSPAGETQVQFGEYYSPQQWEIRKVLTRRAAFGQPDLGRFAATKAPITQLTAQEWGKFLFDHVFHGVLYRILMNSLQKTSQNNFGLRILLRFTDVPELATLPWEYLYAPAPYKFFALSTHTPIVRYLDIPQGIDATPVIETLCILVVTSQPNDFSGPLNVDQEIDALREALEGSHAHAQVEVEELQTCTLECLQHRLRQGDKPIHILHFIGHGQYDTSRGEGVLFFETTNKRDSVTADRLIAVLKDHSSLRLVFLNSCEGATSGEKDIFSGLAQKLVEGMHSNLMAVIAMQFGVEDQTAINLARNFYEAVASGYPIDAALAEARKAIYTRGNNHDWGTPVLFMRARDGKLFDIPVSAQHPGFEVLNSETLEKDAHKIEPKTSKKILDLLSNNHLIILSEEPHVTLQTLAHQLAYELKKNRSSLFVLEWQEEPEKLSFKSLFPLQEKISRARNNAVFIIPEVSHDLFSSNFLVDLSPLLRERKQYIILTTSTSRNIPNFNNITSRFWAEQDKTIYRAKYLSTELEQRLLRNEKRLPEKLLDKLKAGQSELGYSLRKIAIQLRLPVHMDTFVERLCSGEAQTTKGYIQELIQIARTERDEDRIKYLYHHLPQRSEQLLVVGLCLLGGITETQFFQLLERVIKSSWHYAFTEVEILDYYHLHSLHQFFKYDEQEPNQYPTERTILPQYINQGWHLLLIIWESHRNHVKKTFLELAAITIDSVSDQRADYGNAEQRKQLRTSLGTFFSNVGRVSLPSIEDTLLDLASHRHRSIQSVVADAVARWYDKNEKIDARNQLFDLLQRWLSQDWSQELNWKSHQRDQRYVRFTVARTLNQVLDKIDDPMPDRLPGLLLEILHSHPIVQDFFCTNISRKIFPDRIRYIIGCWRNSWDGSAKVEDAAKWLNVIEIIAPLCKRHNQLQIIALWVVDILGHGIKKYVDDVITLLKENRYLIPAIFPAHLRKLNDEGTLLFLIRCGNFEKDILDVLLGVYQGNHKSVHTISG